MFKALILTLIVGYVRSATVANLWDQCGGKDWTGPTTCVSGATCVVGNPYYSQCLPSSNTQATNPPTQAATTTTKAATATTKAATATTSAGTTTTTKAGSTDCSKSGSNYASNGNTFINSKFRVGISYDIYNGNQGMDLSAYDYMTIWLNTIAYDKTPPSTAWNPWYQGAMLDACTKNNKIPLFYAYVIAFEARNMAGLGDCDNSDYNLCKRGSEFIRQNRQYLVNRYADNAQNIAKTYGTSKPVVFVMEPDFWQYYGDVTTQFNGALNGTYMKDLFNDFVKAIKTYLPNALISWDISAWIGEAGFKTWWCFFKDSQIDFIHTSGGQAYAGLANIKPGELAWNFVSSWTGKKIIADCGYGVGGAGSDNCGPWSTKENNQNARISDGVVAVSIAKINGTVLRPSVTCC